VTFELPTLTLTTAYDVPQRPLRLGEAVDDGGHPSIVLLDGANRARRRVMRGNRLDPLVGLRVDRPTGPVRVGVVLHLDAQSWQRWASADGQHAGDPSRHRLLTVTAQGVPRAVCLLVPDAETGATRQRVDLVLAPQEFGTDELGTEEFGTDELGPDGLVVLGLEDAAAPADWPAALPRGAVGALIGRVVVEPLGAGIQPAVSTGRPRPPSARAETSMDPGIFVLNPGSGNGSTELQLESAERTPLRVQAVDSAGRTLLDEVLKPRRDGLLAVPLGAVSGPVLLRAVDPRTGIVRSTYRVGVAT
jgi:hypothetical protein